MPFRCIVPNCERNYKNCQKKRSLFRVPKDPGELLKWENAIPGKMKLSHLRHHVCEKHFEPQFIIRKWVKQDDNGRILAEGPYLKAKLAGDAVPTIFINALVDERYGVVLDDEKQKENISSNGLHILHNQDLQFLEISNSQSEESSDFILNDFGPGAVEEEIVITTPPEPRIEETSVTNSAVESNDMEVSVENNNTEVIGLLEVETDSTIKPNVVENQIHIIRIPEQCKCKNAQKQDIMMTKKDRYLYPLVYEKIKNLSLSNKLPPSWSFLEMTHWDKTYLVFHYTVMRGLEPRVTPSVQRSVVISENCRVDYYLYGGRIPVFLPESILIAEEFPSILERFQEMSLETH